MGAGNVIAIVVPLNLISRTNGDAEALPGEAPLWVREKWCSWGATIGRSGRLR